MSALYRQLPKVDAVLDDERVAPLPREVALYITRALLDELRVGIASGELDAVPDVPEVVAQRVGRLLGGQLRPVLNATGVVVHTNLGRAPWSPEAVRAAASVAGGYCNVEMDLDSGQRGGRGRGVEELLRLLTGAEAALVVNNCAAAVLLALTELAKGREVIVSRGELVEIGGSFRVPDVIASGGATMREVGTTNRTRVADFEAAITEHTAVLLRVHTSNFRVVGFTQSPDRAEMVALARERGLVLVEDLGSGSVEGAFDEPAVRDVVAYGVDLVTFSGDKLLGGPQAGLVVGRAEVVSRLRRHPMYRALRVDKVVYAALEATLAARAAGAKPPVQRMLEATPEQLRPRAEALHRIITEAGVPCHLAEDVGYSGGGALPGQPLPTWTVVVDAPRPLDLARSLRLGDPSVVTRVAGDAVRLDVRTLGDSQGPDVAAALAAALRRGY